MILLFFANPGKASETQKTRLLKISMRKIMERWKRQEKKMNTVRPRDTRPLAAQTSQVHIFELGPKIFEMHVFARFCTILHVFASFFDKWVLEMHVFTHFCTFFARFLVHEYLRYTIHQLNNTNLPMHRFLKILHSIK